MFSQQEKNSMPVQTQIWKLNACSTSLEQWANIPSRSSFMIFSPPPFLCPQVSEGGEKSCVFGFLLIRGVPSYVMCPGN